MKTRGFTLIEVLIALAIFALAAVVLASAYLNVLTAYHRVGLGRERDASLQMLRTALLSEPDRRKAEDGGSLALDERRTARWRAEIEATSVADLFRVTLIGEIPSAESTARVVSSRQTLMLLRPSWSDPVEREKLRAEARSRLGSRPLP